MRPVLVVALVAGSCALLASVEPLLAQADSVRSTVHNLSVSGPGEVRAASETEVCKFCHVPHNAAVPEPLWGHRVQSSTYRTPELDRGRPSAAVAPQPDGASRLCLSCHDGTVALGDVTTESRPIAMRGDDRLGPRRRGFLGTDLSGSHPVSFVVSDRATSGDADMVTRPLAVLRADPDVRLDAAGKMQCTTCHDAHADRYSASGKVPRFWVKPSVDEVCLTCHVPN